jgi:hypothetical protein
MTTLTIISNITLVLAAVVLALIAAIIIAMLSQGVEKERFGNFLFEMSPDGQSGKPSVSRLQMLIWNFVVAFAFLYVLGKSDIKIAIEGLLQPEVLVLLGISNSTYLLGKRTRQGSALPQAGTESISTARGGQPVASGEAPATAPGPEGTP